MPRIFKLLLPLALFLGLPLFFDQRVEPTGGRSGMGRPAATRTEVSGYRYSHYDPASGALVFELRGERATEVAAPVGSPQRRFALEGLTVRLAESPQWSGAVMPLTLTAPSGAVRFGEGGDTLINFEGGVRGQAADGTILTTEQVRVTVAEETGVLSAAHIPGAVQVRGPGLVLDAAGGSYAPGTGWTLSGPLSGGLGERPLDDPQATAELKRSVFGFHAPQGARLVPAAGGKSVTITTTGGLYLDRRAVPAGPVQSLLSGREAEVEVTGGVVTAFRVRNDLRAAAMGDDGRCHAVLAAAAGEWSPVARRLTLTGRPRWYTRGGSEVWIPGESRPAALPAPSVGAAGPESGWMATAQRQMTVRREADGDRVHVAMRDDARLSAVPLTPGQPATRALAAIPQAARADPIALAAYLANRNLQDTAAAIDVEAAAAELDGVIHPKDGARHVIDFDGRGGARVRASASRPIDARAERMQGRLVMEGPKRELAATLEGRPEATFETGPDKLIVVRSDQPDATVAIEAAQRGAPSAHRALRAAGTGPFRISTGAVVSPTQGRADAFTLHLEGADEPELAFTAKGNVEVHAVSPEGERSVARADAVTVRRHPPGLTVGEPGPQLGEEVWGWSGLRAAQAPGAVRFDLGWGRPAALQGDAGSRWRYTGKSGSITRELVRVGAVTQVRRSTVRLDGACRVAFAPPNGGPGFTATARDGARLEFAHDGPADARTASLTELEFANGGAVDSPSAQIEADRIRMQATGLTRTWTLDGTPAAARLRAGAVLPLTDQRGKIPGGGGDGPAPWFDARAERIVIRRTFTDATMTTVASEQIELHGDPVVGQLPAGADAGPNWPVPEWELRSVEPLLLERAGGATVVRGSGGVRLTNYDAFGKQQAQMRAPTVVVESADGGDTVARFGAPFVATGVTAAEAFAGIGQAGGDAAVSSNQVRLISRTPVTVRRIAGSDTVTIETDQLNVLPLDKAGAPVRAVRVDQGLTITPGADGSWTFTFLAPNAAAVPLETSELEDLAKLAKGG